jgi:hypothetical protein
MSRRLNAAGILGVAALASTSCVATRVVEIGHDLAGDLGDAGAGDGSTVDAGSSDALPPTDATQGSDAPAVSPVSDASDASPPQPDASSVDSGIAVEAGADGGACSLPIPASSTFADPAACNACLCQPGNYGCLSEEAACAAQPDCLAYVNCRQSVGGCNSATPPAACQTCATTYPNNSAFGLLHECLTMCVAPAGSNPGNPCLGNPNWP